MVCKACSERVKNWSGDDPKCGFTNGVFSTDNWNCATLGKLRSLLFSRYLIDNNFIRYLTNDERYGVLPIDEPLVNKIDVGNNDAPNLLYISWYKNRGCTNDVSIIYSSGKKRPVTEDELLEIIKHYEQVISKHTIVTLSTI